MATRAETQTNQVPNWTKRSPDRYRRSDDLFSVMLIHLNEGWRYLVYDRKIHDYRGPTFSTAEAAMEYADSDLS